LYWALPFSKGSLEKVSAFVIVKVAWVTLEAGNPYRRGILSTVDLPVKIARLVYNKTSFLVQIKFITEDSK
jgi:hypothetical protein